MPRWAEFWGVDVQEIKILGRTLRWTEQGVEYEEGDKHRQTLLRGLGLNEESTTVNGAVLKEEALGQEEDEEILGVEQARRFRSLEATLKNMSLDRSDVQSGAKEVCMKMANPTRGSWKGLQKAGRYVSPNSSSHRERTKSGSSRCTELSHMAGLPSACQPWTKPAKAPHRNRKSRDALQPHGVKRTHQGRR